MNGYLRLYTFMDFKGDLKTFTASGSAGVRWELLAPHPELPPVATRIALAALQYGRILYAHAETRAELFRRVGRAAEGLVRGDAVLSLDEWHLVAGGMSFTLWPWTMISLEHLADAKAYVATLTGGAQGTTLGIYLDMAEGMERVLAPASALIPLYVLSKDLDPEDRVRLGQVLQAMNAYYRTARRAARDLSETWAIHAALPILAPESSSRRSLGESEIVGRTTRTPGEAKHLVRLGLARVLGYSLGKLSISVLLLLLFPFVSSLYNCFIALGLNPAHARHTYIPLAGSVLSAVGVLLYPLGIRFGRSWRGFLCASSGWVPYLFSLYLMFILGAHRLYQLFFSFSVAGLLAGVTSILVGYGVLYYFWHYTAAVAKADKIREQFLTMRIP